MTCNLGDIAEITMGQSPKSEYYNSIGEGMPFLQGNRTFGTRYPIFDTYTTMVTKKAMAGDVIMSVRAPVGDLNFAPVDMCLGRGVCSIRMKNGNQDYLFYLMKYNIPKLLNKESGTVFGSVNKNDIAGLEVDIVDDAKQKKIARFLKMLDDKIEGNECINQDLMEQLLALYQHLLTTSSMVSQKELGNLCNFQEGYVNPSQSHSEYFDGDIKWLRAVDINESFIIQTSRTLTKAGFESAKKSALLFNPKTIAISKSGTIGRLGIVADYMCGNRAVINIEPLNTEYLPFIFAYLKIRQPEFPEMAVGSVQKNLYVSLLEPLIVSIPEEKFLNWFNKTGNILLDIIYSNCMENNKLTTIRDTLLPKLMSGELDVSTINI